MAEFSTVSFQAINTCGRRFPCDSRASALALYFRGTQMQIAAEDE